MSAWFLDSELLTCFKSYIIEQQVDSSLSKNQALVS